jgi:phosphatidylinositol-3-phosphatase
MKCSNYLPECPRRLRCWLIAFLLAGLPAVNCAAAALQRYDHIVIVMEENRSATQIIGDRVNAPYINSLADGGVIMGKMFAITHPSQPNYIHLFSGADQGILDDNLPPDFSTTPTATYPFRTANLGAELIAAGFTFAGYSEQIEAAGATDWADYDPHSETAPGVSYRRKHSPWVNWIAKTNPVPANQLTNSLNRAFTQFPTNFAELPTVSFVIPNQLHDMHDGSRKEGDAWLRDNLDAYAKWARTNNSLLIITWDEDDFNGVNQIPTVFYGAGLRDGMTVGGTWTHHNTLRLLEDMYGTTHAGAAAQVRPIVGLFASDPAVTNVTFRQGLNGYSGAQDTQILEESPATDYSTSHTLTADVDTSSASGSQEAQVLVRFDNLFGNVAGQVPGNAIIHSAKLIMFTPLSPIGADYDSDDTFRAHRMIVDWSDSATWNSLVNGVSANNAEAASSASFSLTGEVDGAPAIFDVTGDIELFQNGTPNRGWCIRPSSSGVGDGWLLGSSETNVSSYRPALEITYSLPLSPYAAWALANGLTPANNAPDADPDHDGALNLAEFAYNLNPLVSDAQPVAPGGTNGLPAARFLADVSGGVLEIEFIRRKGATAAGLSYASEFSAEVIGGWVSGQAPVVTSLNADWERVLVRDSASGPNPRRFGKVVVTLDPP